MLYVRVSPNRLFIISEYWILIPLMLWIDYLIITKVKKSRDKKNIKRDKLKTKKTKYKQLKIFHFAMNNIVKVLQIRGGEELIDVIYPECIVGRGLRYINNNRIRKLIYSLYKSKQRNGVIYITEAALCYSIKRYGLALPALPIPIEDFIGVTSWYQVIRKTGVTALLGTSIPLIILAENVFLLIPGLFLGIAGIVLSRYNLDLNIVPTSLITGPLESIKRRIPDIPEVVSVNIETEPTNKIEIPQNQYECLLPEQRWTNSKCRLTTTEIVEMSNDIKLDYNDVVNMQDVTGLDKIEFIDRYQVSSSSDVTNTADTVRPKSRLRGTAVNFLDKFGNPENVPESDTWSIDANSFKGIGKKSPGEFAK